MASFAKIGLNNKVIEVLSVHNNELLDANGIEQENIGIDFLTKLTGWSIWVQTSYNTIGGVHNNGGTPLRKNHAGIGYTYDEDRDAFIPKKPYNSWILNEETCLWEAPVARPELTQEQIDNESYYSWNEETTTWDIIE
tara:strand:+ start:66 stop:479 length:414 start_codon:yes stop_codon:yes gene_type:complete